MMKMTISNVPQSKQLETVYVCVSCNKNVYPTNGYIGICVACNTTLSPPKQTAKLLLQCGRKKLTLRANDETLREIAHSQKDITAQDLLYTPGIDFTYNKFSVYLGNDCS